MASNKSKKVMQNAAKGLKVKHTVHDVSGAIQGAAKVAQVIPNTKVKNAAKVVDKVAGWVYGHTQHPEWYAHYLKPGMAINLNYGIRKDLPVFGDDLYVPSVFRIALADEIPASRIANDDDSHTLSTDGGWEQGIDRLFTSVRSVNTSVPPFNQDQLEGYVVNVGALHTIRSHLRRIYSSLMNFDVYDGRMPEILFKAFGVDWESCVNNAAQLKMYGNLLDLEIATKWPLRIPYLDRKRWLYSNIFAEENISKSGYYVFDSLTAGSILIYTKNGYERRQITAFHFDQLIMLIDDIRSAIAGAPKMIDVATEILKAFGNDAIYPVEEWPDQMTTPIIYDEYALRQIENIVTMPYRDSGAREWFAFSGKHLPSLKAAKAYVLPSISFADAANMGLTEAQFRDKINEKYNELKDATSKLYIDTGAKQMTTAETMSAMRLTIYYGSRLDIERNESLQKWVPTLQTWVAAHNTEIPMGFDVFTQASGSAAQDDTTTVQFRSLMSSTITDTGLLSRIGTETFTNSAFAHHPRSFTFIKVNDEDLALAKFQWNWSNYAVGPELTSYITYSSLGNMSLLYVPAIVRQSRWEELKI